MFIGGFDLDFIKLIMLILPMGSLAWWLQLQLYQFDQWNNVVVNNRNNNNNKISLLYSN